MHVDASSSFWFQGLLDFRFFSSFFFLIHEFATSRMFRPSGNIFRYVFVRVKFRFLLVIVEPPSPVAAACYAP